MQGAIYRAIAPARAGGFWLAGMNGMLEDLTLAGGIEPADSDILARLQNVKLIAVVEDSQRNIWLGSRSGRIKVVMNGAI